jgi:hypothetical protein
MAGRSVSSRDAEGYAPSEGQAALTLTAFVHSAGATGAGAVAGLFVAYGRIAGTGFATWIEPEMRECNVMVVLIRNNLISVKDALEQQRLNEP